MDYPDSSYKENKIQELQQNDILIEIKECRNRR